MLTLAERFWAKVQRTDSCWLWTAAIRSKMAPYGTLKVWRHGRWKQENAHRVAWELESGLIPDGLLVLHRCDTPACVNPAHLFLGTSQDNTDDMVRKGRLRVARGSAAAPSKLTEKDVIRIRDLCSSLSQREIAKEFGVAQQTISRVVTRKDWRHI